MEPRFVALVDVDPDLDAALRTRFAAAFLAAADLDPARFRDAEANVPFERGEDDDGLWLRAHLPLGSGHPACGWDGSTDEAIVSVIEMAMTAGRTIVVERAAGCGDTGWEHPQAR